MERSIGTDPIKAKRDLRQLLGKRVSTYRPNRHSCRVTLGIAFTSFLIAAFLFWRYPTSGSGSDFSLASIAILVGIFQSWRLHDLKNQVVHLHQYGIHFQSPRRNMSVLWQEISDVYQFPTRMSYNRPNQAKSWTLRLLTIDGQRLRLNGFDGVRSLGYRISDELSLRLLKRVKNGFQNGSWIRFGKKLAVNNNGVFVGMRLISWFEICDITIDEFDGIRISYSTEKTRRVHLPISSIANVQLLSELLEWVRTLHGATSEGEYEIDDNRAVSVGDRAIDREELDDLLGNDSYESDVSSSQELLDERESETFRPRHPK